MHFPSHSTSQAHSPNSPPPPKRTRRLPKMVNLTEVIGDPDRYGRPTSIVSVLPLIDMVAGRCAFARAAGPVVTGSLDDVELLTTLHHGDVISAEAEVVAVGKSSMLIRVWLTRDILEDGEPRLPLAVRCHTTFVAIDNETRRPRPIPPIPPTASLAQISTNASHLSQTEQNVQDHTQNAVVQLKYRQSRRLFSTDHISTLHSMAESRSSFTSLYKFTPDSELQLIQSTVIRIRKQYLPRHQNFSEVVFGGDILETLERTAVACANRIHGGEAHLQTIGIRSLAFLQPVPAKNILQVEAKVIASSERVVCVIVRSFLDEGSKMVPCHHGIFHLLAVEREGYDGKLSVGVRSIWKRDDDHIRDYYRAMALPLTTQVKKAWKLAGDVFPSERDDDLGHGHKSSGAES